MRLRGRGYQSGCTTRDIGQLEVNAGFRTSLGRHPTYIPEHCNAKLDMSHGKVGTQVQARLEIMQSSVHVFNNQPHLCNRRTVSEVWGATYIWSDQNNAHNFV